MSSAGPTDSQPQTIGPVALPAAGPAASPARESDGIDRELVQQTKHEIRGLVQEVTQLSQSDVPLDQFYEGFLRRVVQALASNGGALWTVAANGQLQLQYQVNFPEPELSDGGDGNLERHSRLLENVLASGQPTLVPPRSGSASSAEAGNPSESLLVLAALKVEQETLGVIEIFQRAGGGPTTQRGYLRFLVQMSELAGDYLTNRRLRHLGDRETLWENLEEFLRTIHHGLDARQCCYTLVNEGRRLIRCDRVSAALRRGKRQMVTAVSGLDSFDRRADEIHRLGRLATVVAKARRPLWYSGPSPDIAPQIEEPLQAYLDHSHATVVAVVPLYRPCEEGDASGPLSREPIGSLIVEQLGDSRLHEGFQERVETVSQHSAIALANALDHQSLFLMPLWKMLGRAKWVMQARSLPKVGLALVAVLAAVCSLVFIPASFDLAADGKLQPSMRREIFAPVDGTVVELPVRHEQFVQPGDLLVRLTNNGLRVQIENLYGRQRTTQQRIQTVKRSQLHQRRMSIEERNRIDGELLELEQVAVGIQRELALLLQKEEQLTVRSEIAGQVVTWKLDEMLRLRPVQLGQALMTVVDPAGDWELELYMPERRMGHLGRATRLEEQLEVTFLLASHPDQEFSGRLVEVHRTAEVRGEAGNTVLLRIAIDKEQLPELRSDTTVTARVHCGQRAIGYVVFHEVLETLQRKVLFWF